MTPSFNNIIPQGLPLVLLLMVGTAAGAAWLTMEIFRRLHPTPSHNSAGLQHEDGEGQEPGPPIFLSHSGHQKAFVERLDMALRNANHSPFFDQITLPKGSPFPARIKQAALSCKLGVVVLSNEFITSKWPMLELEILLRLGIQNSKWPKPNVFPLFYRLSPKDLKSHENLSKWRTAWKKMAAKEPKRININNWEQALKDLASMGGEILKEGSSEFDYIERVVGYICNHVRIHVPYHLPGIQGHQRLVEEVERQFKDVHVIGLHGVEGMGKTTMCKILVNFYNSKYLGRSFLLEFPTDGNKKQIMDNCKKVMEKVVNLNEKHLLEQCDNFDQVVQIMKDQLRRYDVFIAIDNICEKSLEEARKIMEISFNRDSKVLLTSRSEDILNDVLNNTGSIEPFPTLKHDEALQIFVDASGVRELKSMVNTELLNFVLKPCVFGNTYHPVALKALGGHVKRVWKHERNNRTIEQCLIDLKDLNLGRWRSLSK